MPLGTFPLDVRDPAGIHDGQGGLHPAADRHIRTGQRMVEQRARHQDPCGSRRLPSRGLGRQTLGDMLCHRSDERGPQKRVGPLP